jgi:ribonuclease Z
LLSAAIQQVQELLKVRDFHPLSVENSNFDLTPVVKTLVLAMNADVLVHEATNTFLAGIDKDTDLQAVTRDAIVHGHSTPFMAGAMAKRVRAKKLVMNHFSARYKGDPSVESISIMTRLEGQAIKASGMSLNQVAAAWDFMVLPLRSTKS